MNKIISIIILTLNCNNYLATSLKHFNSQVERNQNLVELIICNNISDDDNDSFMKTIIS